MKYPLNNNSNVEKNVQANPINVQIDSIKQSLDNNKHYNKQSTKITVKIR